MSDTLLRSGLIRLAYENPSLRPALLPLIEKEAAATYKDYVEKKRKKGEKPLDEKAWESRVKGKGEDSGGKSEDKPKPKPEDKGDKGSEGGGKSLSPSDSKKLGEALSGWHTSANDPLYVVSSNAVAGTPIPGGAAAKALKTITMMLKSNAYGLDAAGKKQLSAAKAMLEKLTGEKPKSEGGGAKPKAKSVSNVTKNKTALDLAKKHDLEHDEVAELKGKAKGLAAKGAKSKMDAAERKKKFLESMDPGKYDSPEDFKKAKERVQKMSPGDFEKLVFALADEEGEGGKTASLRNGLIRLAYENPSLRPALLPLLAKHAGDMGAELDTDADPASHDQNLPEHYYFNKGAAKEENVEAEVKQFASPKSKDQNKPESYYGLPPKGKQAARPLAPGVHLIEDLSVLGPNFRLVYRELGGDFLGSERVPGYYLDLGGLLKLVVKAPEQSPAGEAKAKKAIAKLLSMMKEGSAKEAANPSSK
jgi:hypothetical protein